MLFIKKFPDGSTLLAKFFGDVCPDGYEASNDVAASAWVEQQIGLGWKPAIAPESPPPSFRLSRLEFLSRLTDAEKIAILTSADAGAVIFRTMFLAADFIDTGDERMIDGLQYLAALGLLAAERPAALLAP